MTDATPQIEPVLISIAETSRALNLSLPTVRNLANRADFPTVRIGTRTMVSVAGLRAWVDREVERKGAAIC